MDMNITLYHCRTEMSLKKVSDFVYFPNLLLILPTTLSSIYASPLLVVSPPSFSFTSVPSISKLHFPVSNISVIILTRLRTKRLRSRGSLPDRSKTFSLIPGLQIFFDNQPPSHISGQYSWIKRDQLDVTFFIISLFNAQHVSDVNISETCWALNNEIIKQVTSSWSLFIQLSRWCTVQ